MNMKLGILISQRYIENIDKKYDEINLIDIIDDKKDYEKNQIGENYGDISTDDIEVFKLGTFISKIDIYDIENNIMKEIE